eukprot:TRINITY_DN15226_c0_g1_i1.p1 TRINITY_DN15226_c0_g1~~TRINITY_DN15226_c0_g1_i1.p1  ORF type:complete len:1546 (-),score=222.45 TRINITY_DN15226_c0_g1_i1:1026-5663(-)
MHLRQGEYRRATTLPPEMLSRYLPKASNKDKDHEDEEWVGKDRFKHYPYVREAQIWGSGEFVKLFKTSVVDKTPREVSELDRMLRGQSQLPCFLDAGKGHYVCCSHGDVITWGINDLGQLGHGDKQTRSAPTFVTILLGSKVFISSVACGENHTLALSREGVCYSWGSNRCGQLGRSTERGGTRPDVPSRVGDALNNKTISYISCGTEHSAAVSSEGELFAWGNNAAGQCGAGLKEKVFVHTPSQAVGFHGLCVLAVSCGARHTVALAYDSKREDYHVMIFSAGKNESGQGGRGSSSDSAIEDSYEFQRVEFTPKNARECVVTVCCGHEHSIVLTDSGNLYGCGSNEHGQLAMSEEVKSTSTLTHISGVSGVFLVSCGAEHTLALLESGLHSWGRGQSGQLGTGDLRSSSQPRVIDGFNPPRVVSLKGSWDHSIVTNCQRSHAPRSVVNEFLQSEQLYLRNLTYAVDYFLVPLRKKYAGSMAQIQTTLATTATLNWAAGEHLNIIFGNIEDLLTLSQRVYMDVWYLRQEEEAVTARLSIGSYFLHLDIVKKYETYLRLVTSGQCVEALQRARLDTDVQTFRECVERFSRDRNSPTLAADVEQLLRCPFERIADYKRLFQRLSKFVAPSHPDFGAIVQCYHEMKTLKSTIKRGLAEADQTIAFWKKNRSLRPIISADKRFITDLSQHCVSIKEYPMERYSVVLFNTALCFVTYLEYYNNLGSSNGSHIHFVVDLSAAWTPANASDSELIIQTPEHKYTLILRDRASKQTCLDLLQSTLVSLLLQNPLNEALVTRENISRRYIGRYKFNQSHPLFADAVYQGEWKDAKMHGQGILVFNNGSVYDGQWSEGVQEGDGVWDDKASRTYYKGAWKHGKFHGVGFMKYRDRGEYFEGEFRDAKKNGFGILRAANWRHVGSWKDDKFNGLGMHVYENGDVYIGLWENGMREKTGWLIHKNGDTYEGEWHLDKMQGRGGYVFMTGSRRNDAVFKGWFGPGDGAFPGELTTPGFAMSGNFGYVSDPLKLTFSGQISSMLHKRRSRHPDGDTVTEGNPGYEITDGKEWVRFFVDKSFDDDKWASEKATTTAGEVLSKMFPPHLSWSLITNSFTAQSFLEPHHCLFAFLRDFLVMMMEACKACGLYFLRSAPPHSLDGPSPMTDDSFLHLPPENSTAAKLARPLLAKLVRDIHAFQKHLERGVLDYFGLSAQPDSDEYQLCIADLHTAIFAPIYELIFPLYRTINRNLDTKYLKRVKMLQQMSEEQLFAALEMDHRFRLLDSLHPTTSAPASPAAPIAQHSVTIPPPAALVFGPSGANSGGGSGSSSSSVSTFEEIERPMSPGVAPMTPFSRTNSIDLSGMEITSAGSDRRVSSSSIPSAEEGESTLSSSLQLNAEVMRRLEEERVEGVASPSTTTTDLPYCAAVESLKRLTKARSPEEKLIILRQSFILMNQAITRFWTGRPGAKSLDKYRIASVDELLPVFMFVVIRAEVPLLQTECNYICDFLDEHMSIGEAGMMTQTLAASLQHIITYDWLQFFEVEYRVKSGFASSTATVD